MSQVRCLRCEQTVTLRSDFEEECPECGAVRDDLVELDAYGDDPDFELMCSRCGWDVESGALINWDHEQSKRFTVDDACPVCDLAGFPDQTLVAKHRSLELATLPEFGTARAAANKLRILHTDGSVPVAVESVARGIGLRVVRGEWRHDGLLNGTTIEVPAGHASVERFVIAHEVGHCELRHTIDASKIEPEANAFASELLLPRRILIEYLGSVRPSITAVARHFSVSRQAAAYAVSSARRLDLLSI